MYRSYKEAFAHLGGIGIACVSLWAIIIVSIMYWQTTIHVLLVVGFIGAGAMLVKGLLSGGRPSKVAGIAMGLLLAANVANIMGVL